MPSARYYREQAKTLLAWAKATTDRASAAVLRERAAKELAQAEKAPEAPDLNPLLVEFNDQQMRKDETFWPPPMEPRFEPCPVCGKMMRLFGVESHPAEPGVDLLTFACACGQVVTSSAPRAGGQE